MSDGREVELLLQVPGISINRGYDRVPVLAGVDAVVVALTPTPEEVEMARAQFSLSSSAVTPGQPLVFLVCGDVKIPINRDVGAERSSLFDYAFTLPNGELWAVRLAPTTPPEVAETFEWVIKTYGKLRETTAPPIGGVPVAAGQSIVVSTASAAAAGPYVAPTDPSVYVVPHSRQPTTIQTYPTPTPAPVSTKIARGLGVFSSVVASGLSRGSAVLASGIVSGSDKVVASTAPCQEPVHVPTAVTASLATSRAASKSAIVISSALAGAMLGVAGVLSDQVSSRLRSGEAQTSPDGPVIAGAKEVGVAAAGAGMTIFTAVTGAATTVFGATCEGVTKVVTHKLGQEAGAAAGDGLGLVQDAIAVQQNMSSVGVKGLLAQTAKQSAEKTFQ